MPKTLNIEDYIGDTYGRLTIVADANECNSRKQKLVFCKCSCGRQDEVKVALTSILSGNTTTCGCRSLPERGKTFINKQGLEYVILDYEVARNRYTRLKIQFKNTGTVKSVAAKEIRSCSIKDEYHPTVAGVGYIGRGSYASKGKDIVCYQTWLDMLKRCYKPKTKQTAKNYADICVWEGWYNYQVFAAWFYEYHIEGYRLDKDLKVFGSKIYSPETCAFIPEKLNSFLTGGLKKGVHFNKNKQKWIAQCQDGEVCSTGKKRQTYLGSFYSELEALNAYKIFKLNKLNKLREEFPDIDEVLFDNIEKFIKSL